MCYICSCFAWGLDLLQRLITFGLACILCCAIIFGMIIAIIAGIAYGYNYSMAEFITFSRSDVTVFMRRGQFYDKASRSLRRSGAEDFFAANTSTDYEDQRPPVESKQLADKWLKTQDTRRYAEVLTRYKPDKGELREQIQPEMQEPNVVLESQEHNVVPDSTELIFISKLQTQTLPDMYIKPLPQPAATIISIVPNPLIPTTSWRSGSSQIVMRNFEPLQELKDFTTINRHMKPEPLFPMRPTKPQSISILGKESSMSYDMQEWGSTARVGIPGDEPDDVDEDNSLYKPV